MKNFIEKLVSEEIISIEEKELVEFGLKSLLDNFVSMIVTILVTGVLGNWVQGILVYLLAVPVRRNAGGYHAETRKKCLITSTCFLVIIKLIIDYIKRNNLMCVILVIVGGLVIIINSPVENLKKRLELIEKLKYKKRTTYFVLAEFVLFFAMIILNCGLITESVTIGICLNTILVMAGILQLKIQNKRLKYN